MGAQKASLGAPDLQQSMSWLVLVFMMGEHLVSVQKNGKHITNSPFKIVVNAQEVGDASRVKVTGDGLIQGKTHVYNRFMINTKSAGYGGLSLSIEGNWRWFDSREDSCLQ